MILIKRLQIFHLLFGGPRLALKVYIYGMKGSVYNFTALWVTLLIAESGIFFQSFWFCPPLWKAFLALTGSNFNN